MYTKGLSSNQKRLEYWDVVKGIAIILVVLGHQIQGSCGETEAFAEDPIFKFIYSFHMPLFMLISGYFFYFSVQRHTNKKILFSRFRQLVLPIVTYTIIAEIINGNIFSLKVFSHFIRNLWFLWAVFFLSIVTLVLNKFPQRIRIMVSILLYIIMFFIPNYMIFPHIFFMYPFFLLGYYLNKHMTIEILFEKHLHKVFAITGVLYVLLYLIFNKETYLYWSYYSIIGKGWYQIVVDIQRTLTGICGSLFILCLLRFIYLKLHREVVIFLSYLGRNTLQLYVISMLPFFIILERSFSDGSVSYVLSFISFVIVIVASIAIIELIKLNKYTNFIFFGSGIYK